MDRRKFIRTTAVAGTGIAVAGCSEDVDDEGVPDVDDSGDTNGGDDTDDPSETDETDDSSAIPNPLVLGHASPIFPVFHMGTYPGLQWSLEDANLNTSIETSVFSGYTAMVAGYLQEEFDHAYMTLPSLLSARQEGLPLVAVNGFVDHFTFPLVVSDRIDDWEDLRGETVYAHAPGSVTEATATILPEEELGADNDVEIDFIIGQDNRLAALEAGEIEATTIGSGLAAYAEDQGIGTVLGNPYDYDRLDGHTVEMWVVLEDTYQENTDMYQEIVERQVAGYNEIYERDSEEVVEAALDSGNFSELTFDAWQVAFEEARDAELWPQDGGLSTESLERSFDTFEELGMVDEEAIPDDPDEIVDRQFL